MTEEKELLTILSEAEYKKLNKLLRSRLGQPKKQNRLSLQSDNYSQVSIDTRIRITNGKAELMQKVGNWKKITKGQTRTEISAPLPDNAETVLAFYQIIRNLVQGQSVENIMMQYESYLWGNEKFEIKLTHQFGKSDAYNCEVEVFDYSLKPQNLAKEYNIPIHLPMKKKDFWRKWNKKVNLSIDSLSDQKLLNIIKKYL